MGPDNEPHFELSKLLLPVYVSCLLYKFVAQIIAVILFLVSTQLWAHPIDIAYLEVQGETLSLSVNKELPTKLGFLNSTNSQATDAFLFERFFASALLNFGSENCKPSLKSSEINTTTQILHVVLACKPGQLLQIEMPYLKQMGFSYTVIGNYHAGDAKTLFQLTSDAPTAKISVNQIYWSSFFVSGFRHIGAHPNEWFGANGRMHWPDGIDHILFLFGLLLLTAGWRSLLAMATSFSLGHMIAMVLVTLNILKFSSSVIEPIIALTIAGTGLLFLVRSQKKSDNRYVFGTVFLCGRVPGMGFASAFEELGVSGLGTKLTSILVFNVGIDLGQMTILLALLVLHRAFSSLIVNHLYLDRVLSIFLMITGIGLFFNRVI